MGTAKRGAPLVMGVVATDGSFRTHNLRIRRTIAWNFAKQAIPTYGLGSGDASETESVRRLWAGQ